MVILVRGAEIGGAIRDFAGVQRRFAQVYQVLRYGERHGVNLLGRVVKADFKADARRATILGGTE